MTRWRVAAVALLVGACAAASPGLTSSAPIPAPTFYQAVAGDTWANVGTKYGLTGAQLAVQNGDTTSVTLKAGRILMIKGSSTPTSTTVPATTTTVHEHPTTVAASTTTVAPSTSTSSTTTSTTVAPTTTTVAPTTTQPPASGDFLATFTDASDLDRFDYGVNHRDGQYTERTWNGDHADMGGDHVCGGPDTSHREMHATPLAENFYVCESVAGNPAASGHLMTSVGDVSAYSIAWAEPDQVFSAAETTSVSWQVNVTDLGARKWWEVMVVPASYSSGDATCPHCAVQPWLAGSAGGPAHLPGYPADAIVVGVGAFGLTPNIYVNGDQNNADGEGWRHTCGQEWDWFEASGACDSKATRLPFSITKVPGGLEINYGGVRTVTIPGGSFPAQFRVVYKDHTYTPDKDGARAGDTWHLDNVDIH